jgi:hypothetical protein
MNLTDKVGYAVNKGDLLVTCSCEAFGFWGYAFIDTKLKINHPAGKELRPPKIRNPQRRGIVCKHLDLVLRILPFNISSIVKDLKEEGFE